MKSKLRILLLVVAVMTAGVLVAWASGNEADKIKVGDVAPDFTVMTPDGEVSTADLKGKVVLINFFATWCPPCVKELPVLEKEVWKQFKDNEDFVLLVVGREHNPEELKKFAEDKGLDLPFCPDEERKVFSQFATQSIPRNYIINKGGKIVYASVGYSHQEFEHMIDVLKRQL
ncbi:TlpA family protein disulfide reductase [Carboxylicivirga sp. A043]|uniref:TlpA family protein disulfide reductase n=1 Tax=Carboxylicivirga litoralis TaxID=2816963 RepID=UPI0021CAFDCB|nr:TlpA disulfide reductase family protein [Carboxylicivirga sp. A043]MCU4154457.1 TlpA family protein disulfide reductase [Carboxylicivirga sp. A043]